MNADGMNEGFEQVRQRLRSAPPLHWGRLTLASRYLLSPLAGFTNLPFRRIVRALGGVGLATTDLVNARGLLAGSAKSLALIETCPEDRPFAVQVFGNEPAVLRECAQFLAARGVDSIDLNMGCPVDRITREGAGASLMCHVDQSVSLVQAVVEAVNLPVTVKMRLGWDDRRINAPELAREFEQVGVAAVAIHGRTREQGFSGSVNREGIRRVVAAVERMPIIGNGDIRTVADGIRMFADTGCHGISIGRGALANPWIFRQFVEWETTGAWSPAGSFDDRLQLLKCQFQYLCERNGVERSIPLFRKMAHWYLKAMAIPAWLRNQFQLAVTIDEWESALAAIIEHGPAGGDRTGELPAMHIPVPSGPVELW
jgi:tRNA-dihydrouridine synthase B